MYKSLREFVPFVPPNTNKLSPTAVQLWLSLGEGKVPFVTGSLQILLTENNGTM